MTKLLIPKMLEKKRGVIVNLSSGAGQMAAPMVIVYSATKVTFVKHHYTNTGLVGIVENFCWCKISL